MMVIALIITTLILMTILSGIGGYSMSNWEWWVILLMMTSISKEVMENLP